MSEEAFQAIVSTFGAAWDHRDKRHMGAKTYITTVPPRKLPIMAKDKFGLEVMTGRMSNSKNWPLMADVDENGQVILETVKIIADDTAECLETMDQKYTPAGTASSANFRPAIIL